LLSVDGVAKAYDTPGGQLEVLSGISFSLARGEALAITGPSGSGKSTLLYLLGGLERPTHGVVSLDGTSLYTLPEERLAPFRNRRIGFVFQDHCLLPQLSVLENVLVPTLVAETRAADFAGRAQRLVEQVGLRERAHHRPHQLSGGEKQRVAIARALIMEPALVLCDEPTGNLDQRTAEAVSSLLLDLHERSATVLVVVTHSAELAARLRRRLHLSAGRLRPE
jgi:lipoprotein-releasing system ATP-binding protein